jgi:hypothetical protein
VKAILGLDASITRVPLLPPWVAAKIELPGHAERVSELLKTRETFAVALPAAFRATSACFNNGDAIQRWALMRARRICLSGMEGPPYLFVQHMQTDPLPGRIAKRQVGGEAKPDMDGVIRLTTTRQHEARLAGFCRDNCVYWEKVASHDKDTVVTYVAELQDGKTADSIRGVVCVVPEEAVVSETHLKGLTVKFGTKTTDEGVALLGSVMAASHCWLRQHSMRIFVAAGDVERVRDLCVTADLRVRTDDKPRTQLPTWTPEIATAPVAEPVVLEDHFVICSEASMNLKTITEACRVLKATPTLGGGVCARAIRIVFDDLALLAADGVVPDTPELVRKLGVKVMLESQRLQRF